MVLLKILVLAHLCLCFQSVLQVYRFAKLKSWAASAKDVTFKLSKDDGKHDLVEGKNGIQAVYITQMVRVLTQPAPCALCAPLWLRRELDWA